MRGFLEVLSPAYVSGWSGYVEAAPAHVYARLGNEILGIARADEHRLDLQEMAQREGLLAGGFFLLFRRNLAEAELDRVEIHAIDRPDAIPRLPTLQRDRLPVRRIFVFGSPRSGTSRLGKTLATVLGLPWMGELHGAPMFAEPAARLADGALTDAMKRYLTEHPPEAELRDMLYEAYFRMHGSASFLDKTPGIPMIRAAPFLARCFPDAKFLYLRRNGISNVLSRMAKFDGHFAMHCNDWAAALRAWSEVQALLPHHLELQQEEMQAEPAATAARIAEYLETPEHAEAFAESLHDGTPERTGAGIGRNRLADTGWSQEQQATFLRLCGPTMQRFGYTF